MGRLGRIIQGILDSLRVAYYVTAIAIECILGVTLMIVTVAGSAASAIRAPSHCVNSDKNAGPEQGVARQGLWSKSMTNFRVGKKIFRLWAYFSAMWSALWIFVFSYGVPAGGPMTMLQVIAIPSVVLIVLLAGLSPPFGRSRPPKQSF